MSGWTEGYPYMSSSRIAVAPSELRASAQAAEAIAHELAAPMERPPSRSSAAGEALVGWTVAVSIGEIARSWRPALEGLGLRLRAGADNLRKSAEGHDWNEYLISSDFEGPGGPSTGQLSTRAASTDHGLSTAPALQRNPFRDVPGAPVQRTPDSGADLLDGTSRSPMPTYDEERDIRGGPTPDQAPSSLGSTDNPFG